MYIGSQCKEFHAAGWTCLFLSNFTWSLVACLLGFHDGSDKGTASNFVQISGGGGKCDGDPGNDQTSVRGRKYKQYKESQNSSRPKKVRQVKSKVKNMLIIFFDIKRIVHKECVLSDQTIHSAYYCVVLRRVRENSPRTLATKELAVESRQSTFHNSLFTNEFVTKPPWQSSLTHLTFLFPRLKIKLKDRHFDTSEVTE
jgi:hypothetical protein